MKINYKRRKVSPPFNLKFPRLVRGRVFWFPNGKGVYTLDPIRRGQTVHITLNGWGWGQVGGFNWGKNPRDDPEFRVWASPKTPPANIRGSRIRLDSKLIIDRFVATRDIKRGEELLMRYVPLARRLAKPNRSKP
jgi:hypothetical protein